MSPPNYAATGETSRSGRHICLPSESDDENQEAIVAFIHAGLTRGKRCLFVGAPGEYERLGTSLEEQGICAIRARTRGALVFLRPEEAYLENGVFEPSLVIARLDGYIKDA